jgi:hypothetical protein
MSLDLYPPHNHTPTSMDAAASMADHTEALRAQITALIQEHPLACFEVELALGLRHQTASARINELWSKLGVIEDSGERRTTPRGYPAVVWRACAPKGPANIDREERDIAPKAIYLYARRADSWGALLNQLSVIDAGILRTLENAGRPLTCEELEDRTGLSHQTVSAQLCHMRRGGVVDIVGRGKTSSGRSAATWQVVTDWRIE